MVRHDNGERVYEWRRSDQYAILPSSEPSVEQLQAWVENRLRFDGDRGIGFARAVDIFVMEYCHCKQKLPMVRLTPLFHNS
jgi:hypothetical protein